MLEFGLLALCLNLIISVDLGSEMRCDKIDMLRMRSKKYVNIRKDKKQC